MVRVAALLQDLQLNKRLGCGKSTAINLISRMYDCTAGKVLVDGRPLRDFVMSSFRDTASVMYQDYNHLPLTVRVKQSFSRRR